MGGEKSRQRKPGPGGVLTNLPLLLAACCLLGISLGIFVPRLGVTYGLIANAEPRLLKGATYTAMSGSKAFLVSPGLVDLGDMPAGGLVDVPGFLSVYNNTGDKTLDLTVSLIQTGAGALQDVQVFLDQATIIPGDVANVSLMATAGPDPAEFTGWFHITGLGGFLTLDVPVSGVISQPVMVSAPAPPSEFTGAAPDPVPSDTSATGSEAHEALPASP